MNMIDIIEFLEEDGEQTIKRQLNYIKRETEPFEDDQAAILRWLVKEGLLPSSDAVNLYRQVENNIEKNNEEVSRLAEEQKIDRKTAVSDRIKVLRKLAFTPIANGLVALIGSAACVQLVMAMISHNVGILVNTAFLPTMGRILLAVFVVLAGIGLFCYGMLHLIWGVRGLSNVGERAKKNVDSKLLSIKIRLQELSNDTAELLNCQQVLKVYTDRNGLPLRNTNPA